MTMSSCCWRGASGIACAADANVNAKASAINLVMLLSLLPLAKSKAECGSVGLMQIKKASLELASYEDKHPLADGRTM